MRLDWRYRCTTLCNRGSNIWRKKTNDRRGAWRIRQGPAALPAARRLRHDVSKNVDAACPSRDGEFDTSTTIPAPVKAFASPLPVMVFTPNEGEASNTLQLSWWRL